MSHLTDTDRLALLGHIGSWKHTSGRRLSDAAADFYDEVEAIVAREVSAVEAAQHDDQCESEYESGAHAWTPCGCQASRSEAEGLVARAEAAEAKVAAVEALADWHDTKADKARRFRPEVNGENAVMDKAAQVHADAAIRLRAALGEVRR